MSKPTERRWGWWAGDRGLDVIIKPAPRHHWIRLTVSITGNCQPGHAWMYVGSIRRDAWRIGRVGLVVMRMPEQTETQAAVRATRSV